MSLFPRIQSPCPYKGKLGDIMDGDICRLCHREVHDITDLSVAARRALVAECSEEICVSYRVAAKSVLAAMAFGASMAVPAHAQTEEWLASEADADSGDYCLEDNYIIVGGLKKPGEVEWLTADVETELPAMPIVYDDEPAAPASNDGPPSQASTPADDAARNPPPLVKDRPAAS